MNYTENLGLAKPEATDLFSAFLPNAEAENMNIIDEKVSYYTSLLEGEYEYTDLEFEGVIERSTVNEDGSMSNYGVSFGVCKAQVVAGSTIFVTGDARGPYCPYQNVIVFFSSDSFSDETFVDSAFYDVNADDSGQAVNVELVVPEGATYVGYTVNTQDSEKQIVQRSAEKVGGIRDAIQEVEDSVEQIQQNTEDISTLTESIEDIEDEIDDINTTLENKADESDIPTALSQLENDCNFSHTDNNFTTAEKQKLAGLSNYDDTAIRQLIAGKADTSAVPTKTSDLTNDNNFVSDSSYIHTDNNFTNAYKDKIDDNFAEIQGLKSTKANQSVVSSLQSTVSALGATKADKTTVNALSQNVTVLQNDSNSCKQALFGKDKLTKLAKTSASISTRRISSAGTLEAVQGYKAFIFNVADYDSVAVVNELDSYLAFYNTATPLTDSNRAILAESVVSVKTVTANTKATFDIPEGAVSFGVTVVHNAFNANVTVVGIKDNANKDGIADLSDMTENLYNSELMQYYPDPNHQRTGNIKVEPSTTYTVSQNAMILALPYQHNSYKGQFLDENLNEISKIETNPFTTPANCEYIFLPSRNSFINYKLEKGSDFTGYVPYGLKQDYPEYYKSPFKDKKFCAVGDSITAGQTSYVRGIVLKTGMKMLFDVNNPTAIPGSTITKYGNGDTTREDYMCSTARVNAIPQDSEVILIMGGTNDYNATIGTLDGDHVETTFYGALQLMLDRIYARCPNADIYLCEMPYKYGETDSDEVNPVTGMAKKVHFEKKQQAIRDVAYKYGCPLLKTRAEGVNALNYATYRLDGVHPNEAGRERLASLFAGQMKSYRT